MLNRLQNRFTEFLQEIFRDIPKSGKSFYEYFKPEKGNKEAFKHGKYKEYLYGKDSVVGIDEKADLKRELLIDTLFAQMLSDFHHGVAYLYLPNKEGNFTNQQGTILFRLYQTLTSKIESKEADLRGRNEGENENAKLAKRNKLILDITNKLKSSAKLEVVEELKLNENSGLIEGKVKNPNNPNGGVLEVEIDQANPDLLLFKDESGGIAFITNNSEKDLKLFIGRSNFAVMLAAGYSRTTNGEPNPRSQAERAGQVGSGNMQTLPNEGIQNTQATSQEENSDREPSKESESAQLQRIKDRMTLNTHAVQGGLLGESANSTKTETGTGATNYPRHKFGRRIPRITEEKLRKQGRLGGTAGAKGTGGMSGAKGLEGYGMNKSQSVTPSAGMPRPGEKLPERNTGEQTGENEQQNGQENPEQSRRPMEIPVPQEADEKKGSPVKKILYFVGGTAVAGMGGIIGLIGSGII